MDSPTEFLKYLEPENKVASGFSTQESFVDEMGQEVCPLTEVSCQAIFLNAIQENSQQLMDMDIFQAEMDTMVAEAPEIERALGVGILPVLALTGEIALDVLDELIDEAYWLVRDVKTGLWVISKPVRNTHTYKKVAKFTQKATNATKNAAIKGWQFVAPIGKKGVDYTKGGISNTKGAWTYVAPKISDMIGGGAGHFKNKVVSGWNFIAPKSAASYNFIVPHAKNMTIAGWELIKPLPGHAMNLTIGAWNYITPKASNVVQPAINFVGDMMAKGYNFVTSAFDIDFGDIDLDFSDDEIIENLEYGKYDSYENYENEEELEEVKAMIDAGFMQ